MIFDFQTYKNLLGQSESSSDYATNTGNGAYGRYQFLESTINWIANILGQIPPTIESFLSSPSLQDQYLNEYVNQSLKYIAQNGLENFIGRNIIGRGNKINTTINIYGLVAGAHLGGNGNLKRFLVDNIDASDHSNIKTGGTFISDYIAKFSDLFDEKKKSIPDAGNSSVLAAKKEMIEKKLADVFEILNDIKKIL